MVDVGRGRRVLASLVAVLVRGKGERAQDEPGGVVQTSLVVVCGRKVRVADQSTVMRSTLLSTWTGESKYCTVGVLPRSFVMRSRQAAS